LQLGAVSPSRLLLSRLLALQPAPLAGPRQTRQVPRMSLEESCGSRIHGAGIVWTSLLTCASPMATVPNPARSHAVPCVHALMPTPNPEVAYSSACSWDRWRRNSL